MARFQSRFEAEVFKPEKTDEECYPLIRVEDNRVSVDDFEWLIKFWRSEETEKRSEQGKKNRSSHKHKEKGYAPRRYEVFVRTHMSKKGTPLNAETAKVFNDIHVAMDEHLELLEKSIQQGDILSHVLGKERNGYVRCVGLGPTAGTLGIRGAQKLKSTKLQMAELEAKKAWQASEILRDHIDEVREDTKAQIDAMMEEMTELRRMLSQSIAGNNNTMHTSEIQPEASVGEYSAADQSLHDVHNIGQEDVVMQELREPQQQFEKKKAEAALLIKKKKEAAQRLNNEAEIQQKMRKEAELQKLKEDELLQKKKGEDLMQKKKEQGLQKKRETELQKKKEVTVTQKNHQKGKEVILYNVYRDHSTPVAKATILSTGRKKIVGGHELRTKCCEVVVDYIIKRDAILPRPIRPWDKLKEEVLLGSINIWRWTSPRHSKPCRHKQNELPRG